MSRKVIAMSAALGMLGASAVAAQTTTPPAQQTPPPATTAPPAATQTPPAAMAPAKPMGAFLDRQQTGHVLGSDYMRKSVIGANNERIGDVNDLVLDNEGKVVAVVIGVGGFLGIGEKSVAVPFTALQRSAEANQLTAPYTRQELENAPEFVTMRTTGPGNTGRGTGTGTGSTPR